MSANTTVPSSPERGVDAPADNSDRNVLALSVLFSNPAANALNELSQAPIVRFSLLALSSIFFLVDPFAAIPSFLAITESADAARRKRMARKGAITCFIVLTSFAIAGQLIFRILAVFPAPFRPTNSMSRLFSA